MHLFSLSVCFLKRNKLCRNILKQFKQMKKIVFKVAYYNKHNNTIKIVISLLYTRMYMDELTSMHFLLIEQS